MEGIRDKYYINGPNTIGHGHDMMLSIARGSISGISVVHKFGYNTDIDTGSTPEDIWDVGGTYTWPTSEDVSHIYTAVDSASTRGMVIEVQGLDVDYNLIVQDATLDGTNSTTAVALDTALTRVFRMKVKGNTDADQNVIAGNSGKTNTYAQITLSMNQTLMALYTIPAGKTGYMRQSYCTMVKAGAANAVAEYSIKMREVGGVFQVKHWGGVAAEGNTDAIRKLDIPIKVSEKTDIMIRCESVTENNANISAGFDIILIDN